MSGVFDLVDNPKYMTAVGLALLMHDDEVMMDESSEETRGGGLFSFLNIFKKK